MDADSSDMGAPAMCVSELREGPTLACRAGLATGPDAVAALHSASAGSDARPAAAPAAPFGPTRASRNAILLTRGRLDRPAQHCSRPAADRSRLKFADCLSLSRA